MCKTIEVPMKLFMCMDKYTKEVFATLLYYDMVAVKDEEGFFSFKFSDFVRFIKGSQHPVNAILNELDNLGIITIKRTGRGNINKNSDMNKYKINRSSFDAYDIIKGSEIADNRIIIPPYIKKKTSISNQCYSENANRIATDANHKNDDNTRLATSANQKMLIENEENANRDGKDSAISNGCYPYSIYNKYILYPDTKEINQKDLEPQGYNNTGDILTREKKETRKEKSEVEQTAELQNEGEFRGDATIGNKIANADIKSEIKPQSEDKEFGLIGNDSSLGGKFTTEQLSKMDLSRNVFEQDDNQPFNMKNIPDVIDTEFEFNRLIQKGLDKLRGTKNWTDYLLYLSVLRKIEKSARRSMEDGYENGTTVCKYQFKKLAEGIERVKKYKFKYFEKVYSNRPYNDAYGDMYQVLGINPLPIDVFKQRLEKLKEQGIEVKENSVPTLIETNDGIVSFDENEIVPDDIQPVKTIGMTDIKPFDEL